jgi:hypothetical protein
VDEYALTTAGWKIAGAAHGDGAVISQGYGVYLYQRAWFAFEWTTGNDAPGDLTIQTRVPPTNTPIACGRATTAGSLQLKGIVLPSGSFQLFKSSMALAPACASDVQRFYEATLSAAGWHEDQPFINISYSATQTQQAVFTRGSVQATITTAGYPGTQTLILV